MKLYYVGDLKAAKSIVICVYDIFGLHNESPNVLQIADRLAAATQSVAIVPDFWLGKPWPVDAPLDKSKLMPWVQESGTFAVVKPRLDAALDHTRSLCEKAPKLTCAIGFCWGAMIVANISQDENCVAIASAHPSLMTEELASAIKAPFLVMPAKDDPPLEEVRAILEKNGLLGGWKRFDDQPHGFCTGRGDFSDEANHKAALSAIQLAADHFNKNIQAKSQ